MRMAKCENGHFYDADKSGTCPYCVQLKGAAPQGGDDGVTSSFYTPGTEAGSMDVTVSSTVYTPDVNAAQPVSPSQGRGTVAVSVDDEGKTVALIAAARAAKGAENETAGKDIDLAVNPIVGWLVCVEGPCYGKAFELFAGKNFIGRDASMDIRLAGDNAVSRITHAIIIYEPQQKRFYAQPGESHSLFYVNEEVVLSSMQMQDRDVINIGNSRLVFVPFCDERFGWGV